MRTGLLYGQTRTRGGQSLSWRLWWWKVREYVDAVLAGLRALVCWPTAADAGRVEGICNMTEWTRLEGLCRWYCSRGGSWCVLGDVDWSWSRRYLALLGAAGETSTECLLPRTLCRCRRFPWQKAAIHVAEGFHWVAYRKQRGNEQSNNIWGKSTAWLHKVIITTQVECMRVPRSIRSYINAQINNRLTSIHLYRKKCPFLLSFTWLDKQLPYLLYNTEVGELHLMQLVYTQKCSQPHPIKQLLFTLLLLTHTIQFLLLPPFLFLTSLVAKELVCISIVYISMLPATDIKLQEGKYSTLHGIYYIHTYIHTSVCMFSPSHVTNLKDFWQIMHYHKMPECLMLVCNHYNTLTVPGDQLNICHLMYCT